MEKHKDKTKKFIVDHFLSEGVSKSTIYDITKRKESGGDHIRRIGSGRPARIFHKTALVKLKHIVCHNRIFQKNLEKNFQCSQPYICRKIKNVLQIKIKITI